MNPRKACSPLLLAQLEEPNNLRRRSSQIISESVSINEGQRDRLDSMSVFKQYEKNRPNNDTQHSKGMLSPNASPRLNSGSFSYMQQPMST